MGILKEESVYGFTESNYGTVTFEQIEEFIEECECGVNLKVDPFDVLFVDSQNVLDGLDESKIIEAHYINKLKNIIQINSKNNGQITLEMV